MKTTLLKTLTVTAMMANSTHCESQGFINLNFENAKIVYVSPPALISASSAIPGWTAYYGNPSNPTNSSTSAIGYNTVAIGGAIVSLEDTNAVSGPQPIQGDYSVYFAGSVLAANTTAAIGQTGTIPSSSQSLTFFANIAGILQVSFNGQNLPLSIIGNGTGYAIYGASISSLAGQTGQLLFTAPVQNAVLLDNIQFSNQPIPEPNCLAMIGVGALLFGIFRRRNFSR